MKYLIRPMELKDIDEVIEGEEKVFGHSLGKDFFISELEINPFSEYLVLEINKHVKGYVGLHITDSVEVIDLYVDPKYQGMGFGSMIMDFVIQICEASNAKNITLEVRKSNEKAINLYTKYGLKEVNVRKAYYDNGEDALLLERVF